MVDIVIEDFKAPEREPHKLAPLVQQLIDAGPDKVATAEFENADTAKRFLLDFQAAARQAGLSGVKRALITAENGTVKMSVAVREKITRPRKSELDEVAEAEPTRKGK